MTGSQPTFSIVIPAFNAASTITDTLKSVFAESTSAAWLDVIVVDDGSTNAKALREIVKEYPGARLIVHEKNRGMCAARNTGIAASRGSIVTILDSDDRFIPRWVATLNQINVCWPQQTNVCFSACRTVDGRATVRSIGYQGLLTLEEFLSEAYSGEYLPLFRGDYVRAKPYVDLGLRKSCGIVSYLAWLQDGAFFVVPDVLRIYNDSRAYSITGMLLHRDRAIESMKCIEAEVGRYSDLYEMKCPGLLERKFLRLAVYARLAGDPCAWHFFRRGATINRPLETLGCFIVLVGGPLVAAALIKIAKRFGFVKRFG